MSVSEISRECRSLGADHVVITGGEPMIQKEISELTRQLKSQGLHITIETAGTREQVVECDLMSISPKMSNSTPTLEQAGTWSERHEASRQQPRVVQRLLDQYTCQLKFVVDIPQDCEEILEYLNQFKGVAKERVLLMPQGIERGELEERANWIQPFCEQHGFVLCQRMHIVWYGNKRGT